MAATASAWGKPGAWALASEEHEAMEMAPQQEAAAAAAEPSADFPSLAAAAAATKTSKKKKGQTVSLAEFNSGGSAKFQVRSSSTHGSAASKGLTPDELLMLPTGPRERTAEELERGNSRGFGYSSHGGGGRSRTSGEDSVSRWGSSRASDEPRRNNYGDGGVGPDGDLAPSRADEADDWGANKRSAPPPMERRERTGGLFESHSKADESNSWISNKSAPPPLSDTRRMGDGYRERRGGYEFSHRESSHGGGGGSDLDNWGKKREDAGGERPRLKLQPRTLPLANDDGDHRGEQQKGSKSNPFGTARPREEVLAEKGLSTEKVLDSVHSAGEHHREQPASKTKGFNPFGAARPREEVLAEKGQDWKKIDEQLESMKFQEVASAVGDRESFGKKGFGLGNGHGDILEDRADRVWRKADPVTTNAPSPRAENVEEGSGDN
uniref:Eukaryotic translation initiation factor 4H n=1 Tax=Anthurium amnicola TaxID=1678845 RepID=A0A1D1YA49_9ARAE